MDTGKEEITYKRLSELKTSEEGVITKVFGHGSFRNRITEMGFIRGKVVKVIKNAPLSERFCLVRIRKTANFAMCYSTKKDATASRAVYTENGNRLLFLTMERKKRIAIQPAKNAATTPAASASQAA